MPKPRQVGKPGKSRMASDDLKTRHLTAFLEDWILTFPQLPTASVILDDFFYT